MAGFVLPLALLAVMYFFLIVPQRKKQKSHQELLTTLAPGDEVVTSGGIYGGVTEVTGDDLFLEIAPDIEIKVAKRAIADRVYRATPGVDKGKAAASPAAPAVPEPYEDPADDADKNGKNKN